MRPYRRSSHTRYDLKVHLIFATKYRYKVMTNEVGLRIREIFRQVCEKNQVEIIKGRVAKDHVHLYVSYPAKLSISEMVKKLKGRSSRKIQQEFSHLSDYYWGNHFWAIGYAAFSSGHITDETIQEYLDKHDQRDDNNFVVEG